MTTPSHLPTGAPSMVNGLCTHILVSLRLREDVDLGKAMAMMREEMIATAQLYMSGKIQQWFSQIDERGALFLFGGAELEETRKLMESLPLVEAGLADLSYTRLGPLLPMRTLLGSQ